MDIDLPFWLVILSFITGVICLFDLLILKPKRKLKALNFDAVDNIKDTKHEKTLAVLSKEPVIVEYAKSLFPVFFIVLILRSFIAEPFTIPSESMLPTLEVGDFIVVNKFAYGLRLPVLGTKIMQVDQPKHGDIMVFKSPSEPNKNFIKRVVGLPGDKVSYKQKRLYINDELISETLLPEKVSAYHGVNVFEEDLLGRKHFMQKHSLNTNRKTYQDTWLIPEGNYFVMGDNRDNSHDSRYWGTVPDSLVMGRAFAIWIHKPPGFNLPSFSRNGMIP